MRIEITTDCGSVWKMVENTENGTYEVRVTNKQMVLNNHLCGTTTPEKFGAFVDMVLK